jgi:hypothetical protein
MHRPLTQVVDVQRARYHTYNDLSRTGRAVRTSDDVRTPTEVNARIRRAPSAGSRRDHNALRYTTYNSFVRAETKA